MVNRTPSTTLTAASLTHTPTGGNAETVAQALNDDPILYVNRYGTGTLADKIAAALALVGTSGAVIQLPDGNATINSFTVNKPCTIRFGAGTYTWATDATVTVSSAMSIQIEGVNGRATQLVGSAASQKMFQFSGTDTSGNGKRTTVFRRLTLNGNNLADYGIYIPDYSGGVFSMTGGNMLLEELYVTKFNTIGVRIGRSCYFNRVDQCQFIDNGIGLQTGDQGDTLVIDSKFTAVRTNPMWEILGGHSRSLSSAFTGAALSSSGTGPDVAIRLGGWVRLTDCYFGPESEIANGRNKIEIGDGTNTTAVTGVQIKGCELIALPGTSQKAIKLTSPILACVLDANYWEGFVTLIDDTQGLYNGKSGNSVFGTNNVAICPPVDVGTRLFTNGGRGFSRVFVPPGVQAIQVPDRNVGLTQNRLISETFTSGTAAYIWTGSNGVTLTAGQTDTQGTTKALKITGDGSLNGNAIAKIDVSSLLTDDGTAASGANGRFVFRERLKAGSLSTVDVMFYDATSSSFITGKKIKMGSAFVTHTFTVTGVDPSHTIQVRHYPGGVGSTTAGDFYVEFPSVSDFGGAYLTGTGAKVDGGTFAP